MFDEQDRQYFYNEFKSNGYEVGSYDDFKKDLNNKEDRDWYYNEAKNMGYDVGTQADFDKMVLEPAASASPSTGGKQVVASAHASKPQVAQPKTEYPQEVLDAYNSPDNKPGNFKDLAQLNDEYQRGELKKPGIISQALGMFSNVDAGNVGKEQKVGGMIANMLLGDNMQQPQDNNQQVQQPAQQEASPESKEEVPVTAPTSVVNNEGLMDAKFANYLENWKQRPDKQGTYFENMVADLLADGTANSNEEAVNMVQSALGRYANRSAMDVTNPVVASLPDDTVQDAEKSIEAQWYSHGVQDKLKQEADSMGISYNDYVAQFLKPAMVQSLVQKYGQNYRDIAEGIATRLYSHDEHVQDRLMNQDINDALSDVISKYTSTSVAKAIQDAEAASNAQMAKYNEQSKYVDAASPFAIGAIAEANKTRDPQKILSGLQQKFGKLYRNPDFLNDMSNAAFKVMQRYGLNGTLSSDPKQFKPMINAAIKNELDQLEVKGMIPRGSADYILKTGIENTIIGKVSRKIMQTDYQNWLEDIANQQYQPGFWENVASGALTFAGDAWSYWLPGAAGGKLTKSMLAKAEGRLAGDLMAKGMESRMAARAAKLLIGKSKAEALKSGAVHGAVTFGGQSVISKPIDEKYRTGQFDENGKIYNPSGWKIALDTLLEGGKQSALGVIMQGNSIANMIGKGRGLATNILADIGGKVVDSGIMTGQQMLERMAHDPNFKPTGKDAAESFLESMANLTAIGLPGMVGKYARFKDAREFNKKYDFTDQDIAELKRFGYDGLRDAFEKVGIGEYAVEGENAQRLDGQLTQKYMDLMNDKSVPEVLKAKMMAVVEGKRPSSFSPVVDSVIVQPMDNDGKVYLETLNKDGGIIDRKEFSSLDEAQKADKKLEYEKTLGLASVLEGEFHNEFTQEHLDGLYNKAAQKYNMGEKLTDEDKAAVYLHQNAGAIKDIMDKQQKGIILTDEEQKQVDAYRHYYDSALENSSVMREFVNTFEDSNGVARGTLRKALESKDKKYAPLVESYLKELYNSIELKREMKQTMDDLYNTAHGNEQKRIEGESPVSPAEGSAGGQEPPVSEGPAPYQDRTNSVPSPSDAEVAANPANVASSAAEGAGNEPKVASSENKVATSDAFVMGKEAYKNGDSGALQAIDYNSDLATGRLKRAFADSDTMFDLVTKAYNEGRDMEPFVAQRAGNLTPAQKEAIGKYVEAMDAKKGTIDALQHADDGYGEALKEQLWPYQTEDGNIVPATLTSGKQVFLKKANEYGGGFVVVLDEQGQPTIKQVSNAEIKEVGTPVSLDEYIESSLTQQKEARNKQFISQFDGSGLKPNDRVAVAMEEGDENIDMTFAGYSEDGKIVLTDGKDNIALSKEEFDTWRKNALDNTINERLDREDGEREMAEMKQVEADKQERYKKGIFGYAAGQPDYSDTQTDPKVAAEYLQETAGEDRKALFSNIVAEKQALQKRINQLREHIASNEEWLSINADLDPKNAETRTLANKQMEGQIADLQARFDNWNKIRSAVMTPEEAQAIKADRTQKIADAGVNEGDVAPIEGREVAVLSDEELKKQYPTMDEASDFITSERKRIYRIQSDEVQREIDGVDEVLDRYVNGEIDLEPEQIMELNTTKAQLQARQANLTESAKELKAQADKLKILYRKENMEARVKAVEDMTPAEQRAIKVENAIKNGNMSQLNSIYEEVRGATDFNDTEPNTLEEYVANNIGRFTLNYEGKENGGAFSNGIQQETGLGRKDFEKLQILAKEGEGKTVPEFVHSLYDDMPMNLKQMGYTDHDIRSAFLDLIGSAQSYSDIKNYTLNNKVANVEQLMRDVERQEEEMKEEVVKAGEKLGFPAVDSEGEPINEYVLDLANWAKEQGLEIDSTSKWTNYADLFVMCKDGFGVGTLVPDKGDPINQVVYFPENVKDFDQLWNLHEEFNEGRDLKHSADMDNEQTQGVMFYNAETAREFKNFVDSKVKSNKEQGAHSEAFDKIVELAKEQKEYWDLMEQGEADPDDVPEVDVAYDMDELLKTLSDEEFKEVSDVLKGIDEEFEYFTADEYERREGTVERKKKVENAKTYDESIKQALKPVTPFANALKNAVESGDKKAIKKAQKELTDALIASDLGHDYLSGQLAQAKLAKKKDELYKVKRATIKPLTDAIRAIESAENIENAPFADRLKNAIAETETEPTEAQKKAGNYKKGHLSFGGYDFTVETPKGVTRSGKDEQGKPWSVTMHDTYGYILGKIGVDGDHIDMFINDAADLDSFDGNVYVVDQVNPETGEFDEHKVMYGYPSEEAATEAYLANYSKDWKGLGKVTSVPKATFDKWLESSDRKTKPFRDYAMIQHEEAKKAKEANEALPFDAPMNMDDLPFHRDVKEVKPSDMTEAQKVAYDAVSTMLKKAGIPVKVVSNEDMEKVAEAQDNLNLAMLLNHPEMRFKIKTPEEKQAAENAYNFAKELRPDKWKQYAVVDMSNPNKMPEYFEKQELARKERSYYNKLMWGNYKVFNLDKSFEDNVAGLTGSFPSEFDPYKIDAQTSKKNELKKQIKETEEAYKLTGQERKEYQNQLMKEYMDEHGLASENDIPDDVWREFDYKAVEKYQDKLDSLFAKYKDLDKQLKAVAEPGVQYLKGKGVVYGYTDGKEIVLNQEHLNPNTPIHEYQHLWRSAAKKMNPELIEHGDKLIMQTQLFADLKEDPNYKHLSDDEICDEAFARLTGEDGAAILEQMAKDAIKENPLDTAKELTIINRLKDWLKKFWYWTLDTFTKWKPEDIKKMTLEDIRNLVLRDLAQGVDPRTVLNEKKAKNAEDADKTLVGVHNISEDKLLKAIKQGGLANPSVAVIDSSKQDHKAYGGISLILPSDKVAKRTGKNAGTWQGDAWTPTYPQVEKQISNKGSVQVNKDVLSVPKEMQHEARNGIDRWILDGNDSNSGLKYLFLHEKGVAPKMVELQHKYSDKVYNDLKSITSGNFDISSIGKADTQKVLDMYIDNVFGGDRAAYEEKQEYRIARYKKQVAEGEKNPFLLARAKNALEQYDKYGFYFDKVQEFVRNVVRDHRMTGVDTNATLNDVEDYIKTNNLTDEFNTWLEGKEKEYGIKEVIFDGFTPSGNRRYVPNTLENVSKIMKKQGRNGATGAAVSFQNFAARLMPSYGTLKDIRSKKGLLTSDREKFDKFREKWSNVFFELGMKCQPDATGTFDDYGLARLSEAAMTRDPQAYLKKEYNVDFSDEDTKRLKEMVKAIKEEHPAMYFETKFERPVGFDEFSAAVVPTTTKKEVKEALKNAGVSIFEYDEKSDADRKRAFNEAINSNHEIRFHRVTEPEELERLNKEKTFRMYSGMQEVDGKLYSPMAAIIDGKRTDDTEIGAWMGADERPDLVKGGKFQLVKTDKNPGAGEGPVRAAYNPYMHTSTSMMNDQFTGAYARGNIKVVEWEIPESEKTSGYRAEGAKDAVGLVPWHSGSVNGLLPKDRQRSVMLSRWRKAVRVVPDSEVAESIAKQLDGTGLAIPWNVVTPNQLRELVKLGVPITTEESGQQAPETKEKFLAQMEELKKEFPQAQFVDVKMTKEAFKEWGGKGIVKSPILEQKLKKHPDSLMKAGTYFSGGGLVEEGLKGIIDPVVAVEYDRKISGVYRNNFGQHIVTADVRDVDPKELVKHIDGEVEYFHASPVCKNYSQAKSNGGEVELDKETAKSTADFIDAVKPRVVTIENVKGYKDSEAMKIITQALDKNGYKWDADVYNAADYGGYTSRERLIVRAVKDGELPEKPKKQPRKSGWLEAVEDILPTLTEKINGVAPWMDTRLKADGIDWQKVEKPLYVMGSAYADGKIPHAYGDEILPTLRTKSGDVIIMPGGKVLRADGRVLARITGLGDDYLLPKTESLAHTIIGNGIPVQLTKGVIAPLLNKDDLSGRNVLARLGSSIFKNNWDADMQKQVSDRVVNTANKLGGAEATVYTSVDEVPDAYLSDVKNGATGWYDPTTHTVHVYLPNCADANEAERTVLHEKIGHEGMEVLLGGEDGVRKFANFVYNSVAASTRGKILEITNKYDPDWKKPDRMNVGTQEYIARLAEEGPKSAEDFTLWTKIKHYLIRLLKKLGVRVPGLLNDKDLRYYLMKAGKALHVWDEMPQEKQEAMMKQASNAEIKDALSDGAGKGKPRQKKGESTIQYMKRVQEWRKWQNAREDKENPEPPMFYDIDKDEAGKKEWAQLNKDWRERHHLVGEEPTGMPIRMENEEDKAYMNRIHEYEKWQAAMKDQEDPLPDMFAFEKKKQEEVKRKYEDWLAKHDLLEQQQADLDLYEGKIYPAENNPKADALEQQVMQDLAEVTSTDVSKEGAAKTVKHAVIHRRKNMEEASADDAIYINDVKNRIEKMADSGAFDKLLSDYKGKKNRAEKLAETIPYIIEAPRRLRDMAHNLNATGVFDKGHIHIQPADVEAIQPYVTDLITETAKKHTEIKKGKEIEVYDDPKAVSEVASKMAQAINANHKGEEGFVPCDGTDILSKHVLKLVKERVVPGRINYKELSPEMQAAIDSIRDWYNYTYDWLMDNHTLKAGTGYNVDYVNHIWDKEKSDPEAYATFVENRQRTKSPNEKKRTISTLMEGIYAGLVPKTTDITKMMAYYSRSNIEAWANKTMLQELTGLNVIERNEKGEVISTDPLLSSSAPFNLEQYKYFEIPGVGPVWVYNVSPKQVKVKNPITDNEKVIYSEASAGDRFGVVFDTYQSSPFWKTFDTLASSAKKLELGFSGFHAGALTEVYMVQNMVEFGPKKAMANFMKYIFADTAKNHELPCFANPQDFQEAASHLVKFGATNDYAAADVQNMFDNMRDAMMKVQEKLKDGNGISGMVALATMPLKVATQMLSLINKGMDRALWDFLHDGLKLATYRMRADKTKERAKKKGWTEEELSRALDEDGQFVNDMFGGQHWDVLGASHRTLRYAGRVLLSPDWNASTTRHFLALTGYGSIWNEATFENFKHYYKRLGHGILTPEDEGRRSRQISSLLCYGIGFMVFYEAIANGINAAFRAMDEEKERKKAEEIRKTNPSYRSPYELAYPDGMKWYDYLMRGNSLGQQSKIYLGRYADGTEMYIRHGKQFREVPEYLFNHKGELEFPGPMVQRMIGKANPMVRMTLDDINYLSDFQASHADQEIQRKYGKTIGLLYKDALYWAPFLIPSQENKEFKAVDFFFPSSKGFSPWKAQSYFKDFILSGDMEGVVMTYQSCQRNGIDPEAQIKAAIGSVKALESAEMNDGVTSLQEASKRFDAAKSITEKKKMRQKMKKFLSQSEYKAFTQKEALDMVQGYLNGDEDLKEMEKAESKYLMKAKAEDVTEDWRIQNVWNGTMETYQEYQRLKDVDKAKANAFKNSKTNKRLFAARKAISAAKKKMNKAKKQMDGQNDAAKLVEIRKTRKELLETLNGME